MKIVGIDASINSTGLVSLTLDVNLSAIGVDYFGFSQVKKHQSQKILHFRKDDFCDYISQNIFMKDHVDLFCSGASYIAIEDYAYAATGKVFHIAEYTGYLKHVLYLEKKKIRLYSPNTIKMFATGNGSSDKISMVDAFDQLVNLKPNLNFLIDKNRQSSKYDSPRQDIIDAFFICKLLNTELKIKHGILKLPNNKTDVLNKIFNGTSKANKISLLNRDFINQ